MTILDYRLDPIEIAYSASSDRLSIVRLKLTATNRHEAAVRVTRIEIVVPQGKIGASDALTTDASLIALTAGPTTPWATMAGGDGRFIAMPLPPAIGLEAGQTISFDFSNIVVNQVAGPVDLPITEVAEQTETTSVRVTKTHPSDRDHEAPKITSFTVDPPQVGRGGEATLAWKVEGAASAVLQPGGIPVPDPTEGHVRLPVDETTTFVLDVSGFGGLTSAVAIAAVMPVRIETFSADPKTPVSPNTPVTLSFDTAFAATVSIDQGIGPVKKAGQVVVYPTQTTIYTLSAFGLDPKTSAVTVTVQPRR